MKGLELLARFGAMGEKKWDTQRFDFTQYKNDFTENDREVIKSLNLVGDGELSGAGMMFRLYSLCSEEPRLFESFYEAVLYSTHNVVYEEFRHGLILKTLNHVISDERNFIAEVSAKEIVDDYILVKPVWENPFEVLVSFMVGEISNVILYREASKRCDHPVLKEMLLNISKDENRHKAAWFAISQRVVADSSENRERYISAFRKSHCVHQAEVGKNYAAGLLATQYLFSRAHVEEIFQEKVDLLKGVVGQELGFDVNELKITQMKYMAQIIG